MPDEVRVQFYTIKDMVDFIQSRLDRIDDSNDGKTVAIRGNVNLPATELIESQNGYRDLSDNAFNLSFCGTQEIEERHII